MTVTGFIILAGIFFWGPIQARYFRIEDIFSDNLPKFGWEEKRHQGRQEQKVCTTETCKKTARDIVEGLNPAIDPCEDFYNYACGGWIQNHPVPSTDNHWNQFDILDEKVDSQIHEMLEAEYEDDEPEIVRTAKKLYRACMNTERIEKRGLKPLLDLLEKFGGWPMATRSWDQSKFDWQKLMSDAARELSVSSLLVIYAGVDRKNTSRSVLIVDEGNLEMPRYFLTSNDSKDISHYAAYVAVAADLVGTAKGENLFTFGILSQSLAVVKFEIKLAKIMRSEEENRIAAGMYNLVTIKELQDWTDERTLINSQSKIRWKFLIENILNASGVEVTNETEIIVKDWQFLNRLMKLIDVTPPRVIANYILWQVVNAMSRDLNKDMVKMSFEFKKWMTSVEEDHPRWRGCVSSAGLLSYVVGYMYTKKHFSGEAKAKAVEMVDYIRKAFRMELSEVLWMDAETKKQAIEKVDAMSHFIGYPNWYDNITLLEEYYRGINIGNDHFENVIRLRQFLFQKMWAKLNTRTNREEWEAGPAVANAFYNPLLNSIIFPAGVLQVPFFDKDQPEALNFGSIGAVVGHEITHGFDDMGRQSDKYGNIKQWWSKETEETYLENALCFIEQYRNYRVPELDEYLNTKVTLNGVLTLDENIADNGGLRAALRAYLSHREKSQTGDLALPWLGFTQEQLFYIGFARVWCESQTTASLMGEVLGEPHAPHRLRVIGTLSNSKHFATTWRCKLGSNMNPEKKCNLW